MHYLLGEDVLAHEARISLAQHGVSVTGQHLSGLERLPDEVRQLLLGVVLTNLVVDLVQPEQDLHRSEGRMREVN